MLRSIAVYLLLLLCSIAVANAEVYFKEDFGDGDEWKTRWIYSTKKTDYGEWKLTAGKFYNDADKDKGLQTSQDAKFYAIGSKFDKFTNKGKTLVIQFSVKHEQSIDCGGGYVKVFPSTLDAEQMTGDSEYNIMFGPDICGPGTKKVHVIFAYKGKNLLIKKDIRCKDDVDTHIYTLIVKPDNTYQVLIDNKEAQSGKLEDDWDFLPAKTIKDPNAKKPEDWDEREKVPDPDDKKPEDWDNEPEHKADPGATKPEDWDDEMDGEWEPPMVDNPEYKGEWAPKQIDNPAYSGKWVHPLIDNPEYEEDDELYAYKDFGVIGLDLWQVKSGTIFDHFLITDDPEVAKAECEDIMETTVKGEIAKREKADEESKAQEELAKKATKADDDDDDDEDDEEMGEVEDTDEEDEDEEEKEEQKEEQKVEEKEKKEDETETVKHTEL